MRRAALVVLLALALLPFGWFDGVMEVRDGGLHYPQAVRP